MIDQDILDSLPVDYRREVRGAIKLLAESGVLMAQKERLFVRVAEGSDSQDPDKLVEDILRYRKDSHGLLALQQLGESFAENDS